MPSPISLGRVLTLVLAIVLALAPRSRVGAEEVKVPGGSVEMKITGQHTAAFRAVAADWVATGARAVATYHGGKFPVPHTVVHITVEDGRGASGGQSFGWNGPLVEVSLGRDSTKADVADDWTMTHEMLHICFPSLSDVHLWLEEGLSTYVEPIARARAGQLKPAKVWGQFAERMAEGQPKRGDKGLDHTHTWGRTYWGGALFCLRADVEIRRRTGNRFGLEHALRAIVAQGGNIQSEWKIDRAIDIGDRATGVPVLRELYDETKAKPAPFDLDHLWKELGVQRRGSLAIFDDKAPLAAVRKTITAGGKG